MSARATTDNVRVIGTALLTLVAVALGPTAALCSTYAVVVPMDSVAYDELDTLNGLGLLDTYLPEVLPITRIEVARLVLEGEHNLGESGSQQPLARMLLKSLRKQFKEEVTWLETGREDKLPTMIHPLDRAEAQYIYSRGTRREFNVPNSSIGIHADEGTPLLPYNDDLATGFGNNEIARASTWAGALGFMTAYGEGAVAGPFSRASTDSYNEVNRAQVLRGQITASFGNETLSAGSEEMWLGVGHYNTLLQSTNVRPLPGLRLTNIHPRLLPWFLRYLGPSRHFVFFGQLDHDRYYSRPWLVIHQIAFKPLPTFEFGLEHAIAFGGRYNDHYNLGGFFGRWTGLDTGNPASGNTNGRGGIFLKIYFPRLRGLQVYQEILGDDNLTDEVPGVGRYLPFLAVSYLGGAYLPRLTEDGLTYARFEYIITEPNYSTHSDSLYMTFYNRMLGAAIGMNASQVNLGLGRWVGRYQAESTLTYTERAPQWGGNWPIGTYKERSGGLAVDLLHIPTELGPLHNLLYDMTARAAVEYVNHINYTNQNDTRLLFSLKFALQPVHRSLELH